MALGASSMFFPTSGTDTRLSLSLLALVSVMTLIPVAASTIPPGVSSWYGMFLVTGVVLITADALVHGWMFILDHNTSKETPEENTALQLSLRKQSKGCACLVISFLLPVALPCIMCWLKGAMGSDITSFLICDTLFICLLFIICTARIVYLWWQKEYARSDHRSKCSGDAHEVQMNSASEAQLDYGKTIETHFNGLFERFDYDGTGRIGEEELSQLALAMVHKLHLEVKPNEIEEAVRMEAANHHPGVLAMDRTAAAKWFSKACLPSDGQ